MQQDTIIECPECEGTGKVYYSCCGDDVKGTIHEDYGICPTCKEHLSGEHEDCESCGGTGTIEKAPSTMPYDKYDPETMFP